MNKIAEKEKNHQYCEETIFLKEKLEEGFITLGERLYKIRENEMFRPQWDSFSEFVAELKIADSVASKIITVYKTYILDYGIKENELLKMGGWTVLYKMKSLIRNKKDFDEWAPKIENLTQNDLDKEIKENKTGVNMAKCRHEDYYEIRICRICGDKIKVYDSKQQD